MLNLLLGESFSPEYEIQHPLIIKTNPRFYYFFGWGRWIILGWKDYRLYPIKNHYCWMFIFKPWYFPVYIYIYILSHSMYVYIYIYIHTTYIYIYVSLHPNHIPTVVVFLYPLLVESLFFFWSNPMSRKSPRGPSGGHGQDLTARGTWIIGKIVTHH